MDVPSDIPLSRTKVIVPNRRADLLSRPRLLDLMFEYLDKKLVLLSAPAGFGKTSLLIDLSHHSELPFCWLSLDALDRNPQRFVAYFIEALKERFSKFGNQTETVLKNLTSIEQEMEQLVVTLANELYEQIPEHFVLVLDDFHLVGDVPAIQEFIGRILQLSDESFHLIIASRILIDLPDLPLMVARDQVGGLDLSELAFRPYEIQALLAQNYNLHISNDDANEMAEETEGWITGLQLSSLGVAQGMADRLRVARTAGIDLFDYLSQQVLDQQEKSLRDFLLRSSLLEEFNAELCESVLGPLYPEKQDWQAWIEKVIQNNLFLLPVGSEGGWIRYHHLFRDFLQTKHKETYPQEIPVILHRLAQAYEERGEWEKTYSIYKQLGDLEALATMIERAATRLLQRTLITLESWVNELPPSFLTKRPGLLSIRGAIAYMKGDVHDGVELLNRAADIFKETGDAHGLALTLVRRATAHRFLGDYGSALQDAESALKLTASSDTLQLIHADALRLKGLCLYRQGRSRQSVKVLEQALDVYMRLNDASHIPMLMMETGMAYRAIGKEDEASTLYDKALKFWKQERNLTWQANVLNGLGVLYHTQGKYEQAVLALEEGISCAQRSKYARMEALLLISLGDVYAEVEDYPLARQSYLQAEEISKEIGERFLLNYLQLAQASLLIDQKDLAGARLLLSKADKAGLAKVSQYEYGLLNLIRGKLSLQESNFSQAVSELEIAETCFEEDGRKLEHRWSQVWLTAAHVQAGNIDAARQTSSALLNTRWQTSHSVFVSMYRARPWLERLQEDPKIGQTLSDVLTRTESFEKKMPAIRRQLRRLTRSAEVPAAQLIIKALGQSNVKVGGKLVTMSEWQTQSVRELFFYFLTMSEPMTKEQIGTVLWSEDMEPGRLKLRFKNDIYRLRRALGKDVILFENEFYSFNRSLDYEYDVEAFDDYLTQASLIEDKERQIELYQKATNLVNGYFLEDFDATWVWPERERLSQSFLTTLMNMAKIFREKRLVKDALDACKRAIEHDSTYEDAYQIAMQIHSQAGNRANAIRLYQTYKEVMERELDLPPSPEMAALYKRLLL